MIEQTGIGRLGVRSRSVRLLLLPFAIFLWILGFSMVWAGSRPEPKRKVRVRVLEKPLEAR